MSAASALLRQLEATFQLIRALSPSLSVSELMDISRILALTYGFVEVTLERNDNTRGVTFAGRFRDRSYKLLLNPLRSQP